MTIEEMRKHEWIVSWSGGKDSTATILLMLENKVPIKKIIYVRMQWTEEIPATLPIMTEFVDRAIERFEQIGLNVELHKTEPLKDLTKKTYTERTKRKYKIGKPYGVSSFMRGGCKATDQKQKTIASVNTKGEYEMIGYAADETQRLHRLDDKRQSIMLELGIRENDTYSICRKYNLLSPLYDLGITRDGCFFCPNVKQNEINLVVNSRPDLYNEIVEMIETTLSYHDNPQVLARNNNWVKYYMQKQFEKDQITFFEC